MLIETHCHPYLPPLSDDAAACLADARDVGVSGFVVPAYDLGSWDAVADLAAAHPDVHPAYGLHPWRADEPLDLPALETRLKSPRTVALGEIGLDTKVDVPLDVQTPALRDQLALARDLDLPVILHNRGAFSEMADILRADGPVRGVLHAFTRGPEAARMFLDQGLHLGLGGAITRPTARRPRRSAVQIPLDRIVLETDAPSIGLEGVPSGASRPEHVTRVAAALAELRGATVDHVAQQTTRNARELFRLP